MEKNTTTRTPFAPKNAEGLNPYVVARHSWGRTTERIEYAASLRAAQDQHGWTRELHTSITVRRAGVDDMGLAD